MLDFICFDVLFCLLMTLFSPLQSNKKTRNRAYDVLVQIGHACGDEENGGKRENLYQFFNMVFLCLVIVS